MRSALGHPRGLLGATGQSDGVQYVRPSDQHLLCVNMKWGHPGVGEAKPPAALQRPAEPVGKGVEVTGQHPRTQEGKEGQDLAGPTIQEEGG